MMNSLKNNTRDTSITVTNKDKSIHKEEEESISFFKGISQIQQK